MRKKGASHKHLELIEVLVRALPDLDDPAGAVTSGRVRVDGVVVTNPRSRVPAGASVAVSPPRALRGRQKLEAAFELFDVPVTGRVALDVGAAAGGFTQGLLAAGASRVYAVDAGHGQLAGSLRQDPRVTNLESTNLGELDSRLVPERIELVTVDLSYLAIGEAVPQLESLRLSARADLVALVKPMFELGLSRAPTDPQSLAAAFEAARSRIQSGPWKVLGEARSPLRGARGAVEGLLHARRAAN